MASLGHNGLVTPYGVGDLGQYWFRQWLVAWWHQAITLTNADLPSPRSCHSFQGKIELNTQDIDPKLCLKHSHSKSCTHLKSQPHLPGNNELIRTLLWSSQYINPNYHLTSSIRCKKSKNLNASRFILQLSLPNILKPDVNTRMKI